MELHVVDAEAVQRNKTTIQGILSLAPQYILDQVYQRGDVITLRDYGNLRSIRGGTAEDHVVALVDLVIFKGKQAQFVEVLRHNQEVLDAFPLLSTVEWEKPAGSGSTRVSSSSGLKRSADISEDTVPESKLQKTDDKYPLTSKPTGICVIFDNENFQDGTKRSGTEKDSKSVATRFSWLGCQVLICKDQTASDMAQVMKHLAALKDLAALQKHKLQEWSDDGKVRPLSALPRHGDVFVCCILSHGDKGEVLGVDRKPLPIEEITSAFDGQHCLALVRKPKVFFIQACQGNTLQPAVAVDDLALEQPEEEEEEDGPPVDLIPVDADFLVAMATVQKYQAVRHTEDGSWFIQSLCEQLSKGCPSGDDIMQILYRVNNDVSQKMHIKRNGAVIKQMPEAKKVTLRRRLVFSPRSN